jgi:hypothetical protein
MSTLCVEGKQRCITIKDVMFGSEVRRSSSQISCTKMEKALL